MSAELFVIDHNGDVLRLCSIAQVRSARHEPGQLIRGDWTPEAERYRAAKRRAGAKSFLCAIGLSDGKSWPRPNRRTGRFRLPRSRSWIIARLRVPLKGDVAFEGSHDALAHYKPRKSARR